MLSASGTGSPPNRLPPPARSRTSHTVILFLHIHRLFKTLSKDRNYFVKSHSTTPVSPVQTAARIIPHVRPTPGNRNTVPLSFRAEQQPAPRTNTQVPTFCHAFFPQEERVSPDSRMLPGHHATKNEMFSEHDGGTRKTNGQSPDTTFRKRTRHCGFRRKDAGRPASAAPVIPPKAERYGRKRRFPPWRPGNDSKDTACPRRFKIYRKAARSATGRALRTVRPP